MIKNSFCLQEVERLVKERDIFTNICNKLIWYQNINKPSLITMSKYQKRDVQNAVGIPRISGQLHRAHLFCKSACGMTPTKTPMVFLTEQNK